jgi:hypothetical protein
MRKQMKLTGEEIKDIAYRLDEIVGNHFHEAMYDIIFERESMCEIGEVTDEDILLIKEQLKRIL